MTTRRIVNKQRLTPQDAAKFATIRRQVAAELRELIGRHQLRMPPRDARGNYPAAEALQVSIARSILRGRRAAGLTQVELAQLAGIRAETLNRIENGKHAPSVATVEKIERALANAGKTR